MRTPAFHADRRVRIETALARDLITIQEVAADLGIHPRSLRHWVTLHAPDLSGRLEYGTPGRRPQVKPINPPPPRSVPYLGKPGVRLIPSDGAILVGCGTCCKAWPRPTRRRAEQYRDLHQRLHPLILKEG